MDRIQVKIIEYVDPGFPGWVRCSFYDAYGIEHFLTEKVPAVTLENLDENSVYPKLGVIAGQIEKTFINSSNKEIVIINTDIPWGIETENGETIFEVHRNQLISREE